MTRISLDELKGARPLTAEEVQRMNAYWRAANYLSVGQIYLSDNPLLREPLKHGEDMPEVRDWKWPY